MSFSNRFESRRKDADSAHARQGVATTYRIDLKVALVGAVQQFANAE